MLILVRAPISEALENEKNFEHYIDYLHHYVESGMNHLNAEKRDQRLGRIYHLSLLQNSERFGASG